MNYTKPIADLCEIIDRQNEIIQAQAIVLAQHGALTMAKEIKASRRKYAAVMGETITREV